MCSQVFCDADVLLVLLWSTSVCFVNENWFDLLRSGGWEKVEVRDKLLHIAWINVIDAETSNCSSICLFCLVSSTYCMQRIMLGSEGYKDWKFWSSPLSNNVIGRWTYKHTNIKHIQLLERRYVFSSSGSKEIEIILFSWGRGSGGRFYFEKGKSIARNTPGF